MLSTLWIMRHGLAESDFDTDFNRALSQFGKKQTLSVAKQLACDSVQPDHMLVSPFRRTQETAEVVHNELALKKPFDTEELLIHSADHKLLGDYLIASSWQNLLIVSHMPIVARLSQYISPGCDIFGFETAQVVKLSFDAGQTPKVVDIYFADC